MLAKPGDQFTVNVADGSVLMEVTSLRCGDVWNCEPAPYHSRDYAQEYGSHMVFTDEQVARKIAFHKRSEARTG